MLLVFLHWRRLRHKACPPPARGKAEEVVECSEEEEEEEEWATDTHREASLATERTDSSNKVGLGFEDFVLCETQEMGL